MQKINILITHVSYQASAGSFIKLLRNSKKYNFYIVGCDSINKGYSSGSMLVDKFYHISNSNCEIYINAINKIIYEEKINVIISAEEEDLIKFRACKISQALYKYIPQKLVFETFKDKHIATQKIKELGINMPKCIMNYNDFNNSNSKKFITRKRISCCSRGISILNKCEINNKYIFLQKNI